MGVRHATPRIGLTSALALGALATCAAGALARPALHSGVYRGRATPGGRVALWVSRKPILVGEKGNRQQWVVDHGAPNVDFRFDVTVHGRATDPVGSHPHDVGGREQFTADQGQDCSTSRAGRSAFTLDCSVLISGTGGESAQWRVVGRAVGQGIFGRFSYSHDWSTPGAASGSVTGSGTFRARLVKRTGRQFVNPAGS
ncbi:MAG: hypothetical protein E6G56_12620 [Actinobacteria bacterium]|nr:MAG: hypothetical protein E6G56_12620 [Actinomycetota bacterium]